MLQANTNGANAMPDTTGGRQNGKFVAGKSGNPRGRPLGARNKATIAAEALLDGEAAAITRKAIELAIAGDVAALKLCLERILPCRKSHPVRLSLPEVRSATDVDNAVAKVIKAMAAGDLTPEDATQIAGVLEVRRRSIETVDLETRMAELEVKAQAA